MVNMKRIYGLTLLAIAAGYYACVKLDNFIFEPEKVNEYLLDRYTGELQFQVPEAFKVSASRIDQIAYQSEAIRFMAS
jgi:hypothetical protein